MINSIILTHFLFSPTHFPSSIMLTHFSFSMINSRCEKVEMGEGWSGRVAGKWARGQKFMGLSLSEGLRRHSKGVTEWMTMLLLCKLHEFNGRYSVC
jgi:hypothetical protein